LGAETHQLTLRVEARAAIFDFVEPAEGAIYCEVDGVLSGGVRAGNLYGHDGVHRDLSADVQVYFAFASASTTAP
jgi:hypothetical protein